MIETRLRRPAGNVCAAKFGEAFLEAGSDFSVERISWRDRAARAGIAALEIYFADAETHHAAFFFAEELVFPKRRHSVDFERGAKALARFLKRHAGEEIADRLQTRGGNDGRTIGNGIVWKSIG